MPTDELMNRLLSNSCPSAILEDGWQEHTIELHCVCPTITARPVKRLWDDKGEYQYTIYEVKEVKW